MPKLSIIIPAFNEEKTIQDVLNKVFAIDIPGWDKEAVVINDGSTDQTEQRLADFRDRIIYLKNDSNLGKGASLRKALDRVTGEAVIIQDADLEYDPADLPALVKVLDNPAVHIVYGSRNLMPGRRGYPHYVLGVWVLTKLLNALYRGKLTDVYTGYKLFRTPVARELEFTSPGFEVEAELTIKALKKNYIIREVAINYYPRSFREGKKIGLADWFKGVYTIIRHRL